MQLKVDVDEVVDIVECEVMAFCKLLDNDEVCH